MKLSATGISYAYDRGEDVLHDVSLSVDDGDVAFVLGANGSGKTTLLRCLSGVLHPMSGTVSVDDGPLWSLPLRERARRIGVVPQFHEPAFPFTVAEAVLMGRGPHLGMFARPGTADREIVDRALEAVGILAMRGRAYSEISGGEQQLALIARGLAQGARCLLMDEPAAHLDPRHQHGILGVVRTLAADGHSFVVTSHQPDSAFLYADTVLLLVDGGARGYGPPGETLTEESLRAAYGMEFEIVRGESGARAVVPRIRPACRD
ncbi:MAG: ABC transporter ATP-binding protein [Candidatus Bipolaricaulis sp.]|nr:ABC transporter ATP-binding protein [Candidatus Bipolaricaulis sp.]